MNPRITERINGDHVLSGHSDVNMHDDGEKQQHSRHTVRSAPAPRVGEASGGAEADSFSLPLSSLFPLVQVLKLATAL